MQILGQTWIFYELGQTHLTQTKSDLDDPDDLPQFQYLKSMEMLLPFSYHFLENSNTTIFHQGSINTAWKHYPSCLVGVTPTSCIWEYQNIAHQC